VRAKIALEPVQPRLAWLGGEAPGRDLVRFGLSVLIGAAFSVVQVFVIPRRLDLATYGQYRFFLVYVAYVEVLNFGLADGAFLRWAGRRPNAIAREWRTIGTWLLTLQLFVLGGALLAALAMPAPLLPVYVVAFAACALCVNVSVLSSYALQAAGDFRRAGVVVILTPACFTAAVVFLPVHTLNAVLLTYVSAFAVAATYAAFSVSRIDPVNEDESDATDAPHVRPLIRVGAPVLGGNVAAGLSRSTDRILVSAYTPITSFALYGFASTVMVAATVATQALSRVALAHAARRPRADKARFLGGFLDLIAAAYGIGLVAEPLFEFLVHRYLPTYASALWIVRALTFGLPLTVATQVVVVGTLQSYGLVRRQLALELCGVAFAAAACGFALWRGMPLWMVAGAATLASAAMLGLGVTIVRRAISDSDLAASLRFLGVVVLQSAALLLAYLASDRWMLQSMMYAVLAIAPTWVVAARARAQDW
jgi:O-antigen/teichoic acid export membrane protein